MLKVNQDPHKKGYSLGPTYHITALFETSNNLSDIALAFHDAGFADDRIEVYVGQEGAEKLDFTGKHHGFFARLRRSMEMIYADETDCLNKIDMTLRRGGMVAIIPIDHEEEKQLALTACKKFDPSEIVYWGYLAIERLWVNPSSVPVPAHAVSRR